MGSWERVTCLTCALVACTALCGPGAVSADVSPSLSAPGLGSAVTVTSPTANQTFTDGQPTFAGAAGDGVAYDATVTASVYSGSSASGTPVQTLTTTESGGSWSVSPTPFANGTYTVQAAQDDSLGLEELSTPVTFTMANPPPPTVTLNSLGSSPLKTSTPTLSGTAGTESGDSEVSILVFSQPADKPVRYLVASVGSSGNFSAQVSSALPDGLYDATAYQLNSTEDLGTSAPLGFSIKVHPPVVTLAVPAAGASVVQRGASFSGNAGDVYGDSNTVTVSLWIGANSSGKPTSTASAPVTGTTWSLTWPHRLAFGLYTVRASQIDDAGHMSTTAAHTFLVVPSPTPIGAVLTLTRSGQVSIPITCPAVATTTCTGSVLAVTSDAYQPTKGGPKGQVRVLFRYVTIRRGATLVVRQTIRGAVEKLLASKAPLSVRVTATLASGGATAVTDSGTRTLKLSK
ncbi:MAG TPA: hypothetical protein VMD48_05730 [Solirubrobacteraceae bacterium]|nr:hypothetical protein [Solirubrobacteraceae bacterium]